MLAAGCFWGVEAVFDCLTGVSDVVSGFASGSKYSAHYEIVSTGGTGHAESVKIAYDPSQISYPKFVTETAIRRESLRNPLTTLQSLHYIRHSIRSGRGW